MIRALICAAVIAVAPIAISANPVDGQQTYDLLFKPGTLDEIERDQMLVYRRDVSNALKPDAAGRDTGDITLSFREGEKSQALLQFHQEDKFRKLGNFPASVGNPMIMFFYETTIRDMAEAAGGSPFYIRNRVKDALIQPSDVEVGQQVVDGQSIETKTIRLYPFAEDPNKDRMDGFGDLELRVTMSEQVPGWYMTLVAQAGEVYRSELAFKEVADAP